MENKSRSNEVATAHGKDRDLSHRNGLAALVEMMPPHPTGGSEVDWGEVESAWQLRFPPDYKKFPKRYGGLTIESYLQVIVPTTITPETCDEPGAPLGGMGFITADTRAIWNETEPTGIDGQADELVTWAAASSADLFCWLTHGQPEEWPVIVFSHGDDTWTRFDLNMTEFLFRVLQAEPDVELMADSPLWNRQRPSYVSP